MSLKRLKFIWSSLKQPRAWRTPCLPVHLALPVREVKKIYDSALSVGFACWRAAAASGLVSAARKGTLPIYLMSVSGAVHSPESANPLKLSKKILQRLPTSRCGFSDYAIRPSLKMTDKDPKLLQLLSAGSSL